MLLAGRYRLEELLGRGGMGWVQRAVDEKSGREVAIKFLKADGKGERLATAFSWEVGAVARLDHPGVVHLYDFGRPESGEPFIVMGLSPGTPLNQIPRAAFSFATFYGVLEQILQTLAHAHARGVFHHDLKPGNVLVWKADEGDLRVQVIDFGIAGVVDQAFVGTGRGPTELLGTASYLAPEKVKSYALYRFSPSPDVYAIGVLAFELAYGSRPYVADDAREVLRMHQVKEPPILPFTEQFDAPSGVHGFIRRLLAKNPRDRFGTATEALMALRQLAPRDALTDHRYEHLPGPRFKVVDDHLFARESPQEHAKLLSLRPPPFAGRRQEEQYLSARLTDSVMTRRPQVILLTGPDGVGKTRLVNHLAEWAGESGRANVAVAPYSISGTDSVEGWRAALLTLLGYAGADRKDMAERVREDLTWLGLEDEVEPEIVLELLFPAEGNKAGVVHFDWVGAYLSVLAGISRKRPLLIVLEDVRTADDARGIEVLEFLLRIQDAVPITVVLTMASEGVGQLGFDEPELDRLERYEAFHKSRLAALSADEVGALLDGLMPLDDELRKQVVGRCKGLPIYAVELIRMFVRKHLLSTGAHGYALKDPGTELPASTHDIWRARLDLVARTGRDGPARLELLDRAAVLGRPFTLSTLREVARQEEREDLLAGVSEAWATWHAEGLWVQVAPGRAVFTHPSLEKAVLDGLEDELAWRIHRYCARARMREPILGYGAESVAIAKHWEMAGYPAEGFPFYLRAARAAGKEGRYPASVTGCRRAAQLLVSGNADKWDRRWGVVYRLLAEALLEMSRYDDVVEIAGRIIERAEHWNDTLYRAAALRLLATARQRRGLKREAEPHLLEARTLFEQLEVPSELGQCELQLGELWKDSRPPQESRECFRLARQHFSAVRDSQGTAQALLAEARLLRELGQLALATQFIEDAFNTFRGLRDRSGMADTLRMRGRVALMQGHQGMALDDFAEASQLYRAVGDREGLAACVLETGHAYRALSQPSQAEECFRRSREEFVALGNRSLMVQAHIGLVQLAVDAAQFEKSRPHLLHLLSETQHASDQRTELIAQTLSGRVAAEMRRWPEADVAIFRAADLAEHLQVCDADLVIQMSRVDELAREAGRVGIADAARRVAVQVAERLEAAEARQDVERGQ